MAMSDMQSRFGGMTNDAVAKQLASLRSRRVWKVVIAANIVALVATIVGCLFMVRTKGVQAEVEKMRNEVGEALTMMSLGGANEAVAKYIPSLISATELWGRKFATRREAFRGMDTEINQVQAMHRLGIAAKGWHKELEGISPLQRNSLWQKSLKARIEAEQKKWPNRTKKRGASDWANDLAKEFWYGIKHGLLWPSGVYSRLSEMIKGGRAFDRLEVGERLRYIFFPYRLSGFTMLRLGGITLATSLLGYLMCYLGLRSRLGWMSYLGLAYFLYLLVIALFIVFLEVSK